MKKLLQGTVILIVFAIASAIVSCEKPVTARPSIEPCSIDLNLLPGNWTFDSLKSTNLSNVLVGSVGEYWNITESAIDRNYPYSHSIDSAIHFKNVIAVNNNEESYVINYLSASELELYWKTASYETTLYFHK